MKTYPGISCGFPFACFLFSLSASGFLCFLDLSCGLRLSSSSGFLLFSLQLLKLGTPVRALPLQQSNRESRKVGHEALLIGFAQDIVSANVFRIQKLRDVKVLLSQIKSELKVRLGISLDEDKLAKYFFCVTKIHTGESES